MSLLIRDDDAHSTYAEKNQAEENQVLMSGAASSDDSGLRSNMECLVASAAEDDGYTLEKVKQ